MEYAPKAALKNPDLFKEIIPPIAGWLLEYAPATIRSNKDIIRLALKSNEDNGWGDSILEYLPKKMLQDREASARL